MAYRFRYKNRLSFYAQKPQLNKPFGASYSLNRPNLGLETNQRFAANEVKDFRARENLELLESVRHPRERDFYQDHTYHDQWEQRDLEARQQAQLTQRYPYFDPNFAIKDWIWHPGDIVEIIDGPSAGQRGSIIAVVPYKNQVIVQNICVKDVTLPAGDGRPEQVVQREHPIDVRITKHVDPSNGQLCDLKHILVKAKNEDGTPKLDENGEEVLEKRRISLLTGTILPIPVRDDKKGVATGDPLRDTPYHDAIERTYDADKEMAVLVERKLAALEGHFVEQLAKSYMFHDKFERKNASEMRRFQHDVWTNSVSKVVSAMQKKAEQLDDWWFEELAPRMAALERRDAKRAKMRHKRLEHRNRSKAAAKAPSADSGSEDDEEEFDDESEEEEAEKGGEAGEQARGDTAGVDKSVSSSGSGNSAAGESGRGKS